MTPETVDKLDRYRVEMARRNIPSDVIEQWTSAALPCATLRMDGDGPVVGRFGGPLLLPPDTPDPEFPFVASLNCADLSEKVTGLALPPDGRLLLFAFPDLDAGGQVIHIPEGATVEERTSAPEYYEEDPDALEVLEQFPQGVLHLSADVSLPFHISKAMATEHGWRGGDLPWTPYAHTHSDLWHLGGRDIPRGGWVQVGGHALEQSMEVNPVESAALSSDETYDLEDWLLLAGWHPRIEGRAGFALHWAIRRQELAARHFERANESMHWNP
ncbi:hypothetical protein ACFY93_32285 [Streptomyces sp. NPDC008313]|uniref:hypothetical protein n=1 Tax=Streptomyces sp. NPDC008313 TaxID=3364826 RepID=UPI0036EE1EEA